MNSGREAGVRTLLVSEWPSLDLCAQRERLRAIWDPVPICSQEEQLLLVQASVVQFICI